MKIFQGCSKVVEIPSDLDFLLQTQLEMKWHEIYLIFFCQGNFESFAVCIIYQFWYDNIYAALRISPCILAWSVLGEYSMAQMGFEW